jgi:outer membrane murein-binding lipoprotein Lpp
VLILRIFRGKIKTAIKLMKNEDRIVELLAESLRKLDQHSELFVKQSDLLEKLVDGQLKNTQAIGALTDQMGLMAGQVNKNTQAITVMSEKIDHLSTDFRSLSSQFDGLLKFFMNMVGERINTSEKDVATLKEKQPYLSIVSTCSVAS